MCENCDTMFLSYVINTAVLSVDQIGVVPWSLFLWLVWLILHSIYKALFQGLLRRIAVKEPQRRRLVKIYWTIAFTAITIPFALENLNLTLDDVKGRFYQVLENQQWLNRVPEPSVQTKLSYVLLSGFYLNNISEISVEGGIKSLEFFIHEFLAIFFISTFPLRCVLFGIALITIINAEKLLLECAKLLSTLGVVVRSKVLDFLACFMFAVHTVMWGFIYLHILPKYFLIKSFSKTKRGDDIQQITIMLVSTFSLWSFYVLEIYSSPISRMICNYLYGRMNNLDNILFKKEIILDDLFTDNEVHRSFELEKIVEVPEENVVKDKEKNKENLLLLYHTVKCVIRIKRKLNRMREKKNAKDKEEGENSQQNADEGESSPKIKDKVENECPIVGEKTETAEEKTD